LLLAVHEAFTNVLKHSKAEQVDVFIIHNASTFEIAVSDNGSGFSSVMASQSADSTTITGDGLRNMKQRLAEIGGQCFIDSKPGQGTTVRFVLPLGSLKEERLP
jgi:signal transduction histidine kinase